MNAIRAYNAQIDACVTSQTAFNRTMLGASKSAQEMVAKANGNTVALNNLTRASKASALGMTTLSVALNMIASLGITLVIQGIITGISKLASASDDIAEKAKQIGEAYKSTQSEISGYKERIEELHKTINSSSSSIEEVTAARQSLMDIQGEMIEKYGSEKEVIDMVTDAVNNQSDAFDRLSEKKYQESVNEFNKSGFWEGVANSFSGYSDNMDRMVSEMEEPVTLNLTSAANRNKKEYEKFEKIISQYGKLGTGKYNGNGVDFFNIELSGGLESVYEKLLKIQETASGFDFGSNDFNKSLTNIINETKEKLDKYSELYDSYILQEKILSKSGMENGYDKSFENINNAMKKYTDAKLDGGEEKIRSAGEEYASILTDELSKISPDDENVKNYLQNLYPEMQEIVGGWDLQYDLKANPDSGTQLRDALGKFSGTNEIKKYDVSASNDPAKNEAYAFLEGYADKYNLTLDQLIDKSQELGFVQDENYNVLVDKFGEDNIKKLTPDELEIAYTIKNTGNMSFEDLQKAIEETKKEAVKIDIESLQKTYKLASEDVTALTTALSESVSGKGLSTDSVDAVTSIFGKLKGYDADKLLDKTANGLRINTRELEKLKKEYDDNTAKEFYNNVEDAYNAWQTALMNGEEQSVIDSLREQYNEAAQLADQYVGLTSAYNQWQNALSTANEGDMYDSIYNNIKSVKELYKKGLVGTDDFRTYVDLISPKDLAGATTDEIVKAYHESIGKINRYFTEGQSGAQNFLKDVQKINSEWAHMNKDGSWEIDFGAGGSTDKDVAKKLGIDVEALQAILRKLSDYGFDIDLGSGIDSLEMMGKSADKAYAKLKKLGKTNYKFKFDTGDIAEVNKQIAKAEKVLDKFRDKDGNVDLSINGAQEAQSMLIKLMTEKQELEKPAILKVNTEELSGKAASVVTMLQKIQQDINTYDVQVAVGADTTEAEKKINSDIKAIKENYGNELANIHINLDNIDSARQELSTLTQENIDVMVNAIVNHKEVDEYKKEKEEKKLKVITEVDDKAVNSFMGKTLEKTIKAKVEVDDSELDKASSKKSKDSNKKKKETKSKSDDKKAKADGTFNTLKDTLASRGFANASGNISIPKDQTALVNEMGEELIVRDGKWFTVKGGAQFKELKKGDIVFNHLQTRQLLKNGKITSSNNRGKMAFASGSMNTGSSSGNGKFYGDSSSSTKKKSTSKKSSKSKKSSSNSSDKKNSKQVIDWIARKLDILQGKIDLTKEKFENLFSVRKQNNNVKKQIVQTTKLLNAQEKAVTKYQKKAGSIKLSRSLKEKVRNGAIKGSLSELIKKYGEKTANQINKYQDYIDKVNEAKKAVEELKTAIKELSKQKLEIKLEDNERKRTYQEARYANAKTADAKNKILGKEIDTYNSDDRAYNRYYKRAVQSRNKDGKEAKTAVSKVKGLSKKDKNNIKKLIKKGQAIPSALMKKVEKYNASAYKKLADYNNSVDFVADALRDKKLANEENKTNRREKKAEQHQNRADEAEAKYNVKQQREANAATAKEKNKHEAASMKYLKNQYKHLIEIAKLEGDTTEQKRLQLELDEKIAESYKTRYDNIKTEYENKTGLNDAQIATVQAQIATLEAAGKSATKEIYEGMMKVSADTKEKLLKERAELEEAGKKFEYGSEEWYAWQNDLLAIGQQMESCTQNTIEFQKAINELDLKKFSLIAAQLDATQSHLDFLVNMLSHKDLVSKESGGFTDEGIAAISLRFSDMENKETIVKNAQNTLKKLYGQHLSGIDGLNEEEFLAKREEQLDIIRDSIEAIADEKDAILDLVEDAIQVQIDAINELIEKKRKALQSEKDLYEYQKKVAKQTKNIALIQKQIAALSGDKSEEAQARLQKLKVSLEEAQQDLKDTEYDKWLSDQEDMLDDLADEMEDFWENIINELRDDINGSMDKLTQMVSDNPEAVARALDTLGLGDALSVITAYNKDDTHTDKTTDYGGSSYSSTYDDKTGTNVNNTFKTSIDDLVASTGKVSDSAEELAKRAEEEAKRKADQERIAKQKADQERFAKQKKEDAKMEAYKRADSIMEQVYSGSKSVSVTSAPKEGVQAIVEEFLNSSALHKPKSEKEKKRIKTDPLLKYISENYSGKTLSLANEIKLGAYLGIPVSSKDKVTSSEANKILKAFKGAGFSEGGIVSEINKAIKENGDDGIATVKKGEAFLTPKQTEAMQEQTEAVQDLSERYIRVGSGLTPEQEDYLKSFISTSPIPTQTVENMEKMTKAFEVNNNYSKSANVSVGEVHVHLDGSNIVDKESFRKTLRDYEVRSDIEQIALGDLTLKKGSVRNSMRYI